MNIEIRSRGDESSLRYVHLGCDGLHDAPVQRRLVPAKDANRSRIASEGLIGERVDSVDVHDGPSPFLLRCLKELIRSNAPIKLRNSKITFQWLSHSLLTIAYDIKATGI